MSTEISASTRKNPSREQCEQTIHRILSTEILQHGRNLHFKQASDFMNYFQSLYPASNSLTKQVQRAIKSMNMPKDENGFFIPDKTEEQLTRERELKVLLQHSESYIDTLYDCEPLFLKLDPALCDYATHLIHNCSTFQNKYVTVFKASNGLIFYTKYKKQLEILLESLL